MDKNEFVEELRKINIEIDDYQLRQLEQYYHLLIEWNEKVNLTRITEEKEVYLKHFYDSLTISRSIDLTKKQSLCDIGTGAGFPGIVLKIVFPNLSIVLIDALQKRVNFLNLVIKELKLDNIVAIHERAEIYAKNNREKFDIVTSRAVANLNELLEYSIPLVKEKGFFVPMKANCEAEIEHSMIMLEKLFSKIVHIDDFSLPYNGGHRTIIRILKDRKTSNKYPRNYSAIKKNK